MRQKLEELTVQIKYKDVGKTFSGSTESVWVSINRFFAEFIPTFELSKKLVLNVDLQKLGQECENIIAFAEEDLYILVPKDKLTDSETLELLLLAEYLSHCLGKTESVGLSKDELQTKLGKTSKITSTRLGELVKSEIATKTQDERYRITTFGLFQMQKEVLPKIKTKLVT